MMKGVSAARPQVKILKLTGFIVMVSREAKHLAIAEE